jgi:superfamily II DNA/RNA helicase
MHGNKTQGQRERALAQFDSGRVDALVATDVAARGIDVRDITHVINFDAPAARDDYVHRVGRTGRAGATGVGHHVRDGRAATRRGEDRRRARPARGVRRGGLPERAAAPGDAPELVAGGPRPGGDVADEVDVVRGLDQQHAPDVVVPVNFGFMSAGM